jgi:hypothetical protein
MSVLSREFPVSRPTGSGNFPISRESRGTENGTGIRVIPPGRDGGLFFSIWTSLTCTATAAVCMVWLLQPMGWATLLR